MTEKTVLIPGPSHPITIEHSPSRVVVKFGGVVVADTKDAVTLKQPSSPTRFVIPTKDVKMEMLARSEKTSYCPYKGDVSYFNLKSADANSANAAFAFENPHAAVAELKDRVGFYTEKVDSIEESAS
ncbi:MAG: DUF427 domain-containing protein [Candidatus Obscuribacterales bacterium]|jgi:uncharacterized protein (DUF427 family)